MLEQSVSTEDTIHIGVRLPKPWVIRLEEVVHRKNVEFGVWGISRSDLVRLYIREGLDRDLETSQD